jgi:aryl carrier-like protein
MSYSDDSSQIGNGSSDDAAEISSAVLNLARDLLEIPDVSLDDDFFSVGGDSILAMHLVGELTRRTSLRLRVSLLLANPVLRDFCVQVEAVRRASSTLQVESKTPLMAMLRAAGLDDGGRDAG